ncbi:MAG TPA: hypothetical protein VGR19_10305 [Allosphingosinicella sp.]|nr:hypothetical protein [Allosphingosinicella sp.]
MLTTLIALAMAPPAPDTGMSTLLSCYFEQARSSQQQGLEPGAYEARLQSACQAQQAAAEQASAKRLVDSGRPPAQAQGEAAEAVRQARAAMVKVYVARQQTK